MPKKGLFVGLITLDLIYLAESPPLPNQKIVAQETAIAAGGPATNAAVAFQALGNSATILGALGQHPITSLIRADLENCGVAIADLDPTRTDSPPVSSIVVTQATGDRAVVSINAVKSQISVNSIPSNILDGVDIVLIDGHQMEVGAAISQFANLKNIPVVMDGGSWKPGFETVLPCIDYAICSANFQPPNAQDVVEFLNSFGISQIAITHGKDEIEAWNQERFRVEVPHVSVVDTLGAGDIFHGAFCHYILEETFATALSKASKVAAGACQFFGTRAWLAADFGNG
jgi:sugar/nucleoside kinase (ribokinase family)